MTIGGSRYIRDGIPYLFSIHSCNIENKKGFALSLLIFFHYLLAQLIIFIENHDDPNSSENSIEMLYSNHLPNTFPIFHILRIVLQPLFPTNIPYNRLALEHT